MKKYYYLVSIILMLLLTACSSTSTTPTVARVNVFGTNANHPHSLLAFQDKVLVLATHYGLFRSGDNGVTWTQVAGGTNQLMAGLMTYSLVSSPLDFQRLYVLTQPVTAQHQGTLGLYTSDDQGSTWKLVSTNTSLNAHNDIYLVAAGSDTPGEVYIYITSQGAQGLKVSMDGGQHFTNNGTLPFGSLTSLLAVPGAKGDLLAGSSEGMAYSTDGGKHWTHSKGVTGGVYGNIVTAAPGQPIYVTGDNGIYASHDGGQSFTLVNTQAAYGSLTVSPIQPQVLYGRTATAVYRSDDGGHTWKALPHIAGNLFSLVADPQNALQVYLSLSYPTAVYHFDQASGSWSSLTPGA